MIRLEARSAFPSQAQLGEGPIWSGNDLLWVDIIEGKVLRSRASATSVVKACGEPVSAAFPRQGGGYLLLQNDAVAVLDSRFHEIDRISVPNLPQGSRLSDGAVGPSGELWFGSMRTDLSAGGSLYRLRPGEAQATEVVQGLGMPNGIGFSPDGRLMYLVDSANRTVNVFDYRAETQEVSGARVFVEVSPDLGTPDGLAVDAAGGVWVAMWSGGRLRRAEHDGTWSQEILVPAKNVTSCAFGGDELRTLFITTALVELSAEERAQQPQAGSVFAILLPVGGVPQQEARI